MIATESTERRMWVVWPRQQMAALSARVSRRGTYYFGYYFYFFGFTRPSHARAHGER